MKFWARYFFLLIICVACFKPAVVQTPPIDSMERALKQPAGDSERLFTFLNLAGLCYKYDSAKGLYYLNEGYVMVKKLNWNYATAEYYNNKAIIKQYANDNDAADLLFDTSIIFFQKVINANDDIKNIKNARLSIATCNGQKGDILLAKEKSKEAITAYIEALKAWQASDDPQKQIAIATYYTKISTIYYKLNQFDKALKYDKLALDIFLSGTNEEGKAYALIYLCNDFNALKQPDSSLVYLSKAAPIVKKLNISRLNIQYYNKLAQISRLKNDYTESISYYGNTISEAMKEKDFYQIVASQKMIGVCYEKLGDFSNARKYLLIAFSLAKVLSMIHWPIRISALHRIIT